MFSKINGHWGINSFGLKVIGIVLMVADHTHEMFYYVGAPEFLTMVGRVVAPIFLFLAAEGYHYTHSKVKYLRNLLIGFWITALMEMDLQNWLPNDHIVLINSIFGTLFLAVLAMWVFDSLKHPRKAPKTFAWGLLGLAYLLLSNVLVILLLSANSAPSLARFALFLPTALTVEGGFIFILLALFFHIFRGNKWLQAGTLVILGLALFFLNGHGDFAWLLIFAAPLILLYTGKEGRKEKWFFYIFYPSHIALLYIIATLYFPK